MTEEEKAFEREIRAQLKGRARIVKDAEAEVKALLARALEKVLAILADQPTDYQLWSLPQLVKEIGVVAAELGDSATAATATAAQAAWNAGTELVLAPLEGAGLATRAVIAPHIDARQLLAMKHFMADRMKDVSLQAANKVNAELGLVVIGAQSPFEAQVAIRGVLKEASAARAATIVRTELLRTYSTASQEAMKTAADEGVPMDKVWRRSSKAHPRLSHALADGQRVASDKPFLIGGIKMMHPHDPKAPAKEVINCGCVSVPKPRGWITTVPDHKPFTRDELNRNPTLKTVVEGREDLARKTITDYATAARTADGKTRHLPLGRIESQARLLADTGLDTAEYKHILDAAKVRHIMDTHGNAAKEAKQGQRAVTEADIARLPEVVDFYNTAQLSKTTTKAGLSVLEFVKSIGGEEFNYRAELRPGKKHLAPATLFIKV